MVPPAASNKLKVRERGIKTKYLQNVEDSEVHISMLVLEVIKNACIRRNSYMSFSFTLKKSYINDF